MKENGSTAAAASAGRATTIGVGVLAAVGGMAAVGVVLGLRVANKGPEPLDQNWWLVAWLIVGLADALAGAALVTRFGHRLGS